MDAADSPRALVRQWLVLLLAPTAWAAALGSLFVLTRHACVNDTRTPLWSIAALCVLLALLSAVLAWREHRLPETAGDDRARFMIEVALGLSALFGAVLVLTAIPILLLSTCRT